MINQPKEEYRRLGDMLATDDSIEWEGEHNKHELIHKCAEVVMCDLPEEEFWEIHRYVQDRVYKIKGIII